MAFQRCGWALGGGLVSLAGIGFAIHRERNVQHLEECIEKLEVEKEEMSKDLMQLQLQNVELSSEVEGLDGLVRELKDHNTMLMELYSAASQGRECMEEKLLLAEKQVEDYAVFKKEASKILKQLQSEKQELESSLYHALEKLQKEHKLVEEKEGEVDALLAQKMLLENSLLDALEKVNERQHAFEAYRTEMEISMAAAFEKVREKEHECEDLTVHNKRVLQEKVQLQSEIELLSGQKIEDGKSIEALKIIVEVVADGNKQLQKQAKELQLQVKDYEMALHAQTCGLQNHSNLYAMQVQTPAESLEDGTMQERVSNMTVSACGLRTNRTSLGEIQKSSYCGITTCQNASKSIPPNASLRDEKGQTMDKFVLTLNSDSVGMISAESRRTSFDEPLHDDARFTGNTTASLVERHDGRNEAMLLVTEKVKKGEEIAVGVVDNSDDEIDEVPFYVTVARDGVEPEGYKFESINDHLISEDSPVATYNLVLHGLNSNLELFGSMLEEEHFIPTVVCEKEIHDSNDKTKGFEEFDGCSATNNSKIMKKGKNNCPGTLKVEASAKSRKPTKLKNNIDGQRALLANMTRK